MADWRSEYLASIREQEKNNPVNLEIVQLCKAQASPKSLKAGKLNLPSPTRLPALRPRSSPRSRKPSSQIQNRARKEEQNHNLLLLREIKQHTALFDNRNDKPLLRPDHRAAPAPTRRSPPVKRHPQRPSKASRRRSPDATNQTQRRREKGPHPDGGKCGSDDEATGSGTRAAGEAQAGRGKQKPALY